MPLRAAFGSSISIFPTTKSRTIIKRRKATRNVRFFCCSMVAIATCNDTKSGVIHDSLRLLEWDKLCDSVASFTRTSLGRQATQAQLWSLDLTYLDSLRLLDETNGAIEMHKHGGCRLDLTGIDLVLVQSAIRDIRRGLPLRANEALAVVALLQFLETLQLNLKAAIKEDADWYSRFEPLSRMIMELVVNRSLIKLILQVVDEDGSVKDSASPTLKQSREQVRLLDRKLYQLMDRLIRNENSESSLLEMQIDLDEIEKMLNSVIQLDVINARATYSLSFGGTCPFIFLPEHKEGSLTHGAMTSKVSSSKREWALYLPNAYHPLLLQQHKQNLQKARKDLKNATVERRRKLQGQSVKLKGETNINLSSLEMQIAALELAHPVPVDFFIARKTRVLIITGPNTGGKTISLKTIGLAAMMAKSGLHVLSSESAQIPWFDSIFADIGDEQSLSQSLSTFSGHLKQISDIQSLSTSQSLVLLDEVGAGTNPLEGAALGMSLLEAFAESSALLTIATTHHSELKTLKYSDGAFENACMEFDEVNLRPTYKILWGVPGRSNAINIAERLGLPSIVVQNARQLYGATSAEINRVIIDMERFKHEVQDLLPEAGRYLMLSRDLHEILLLSRKKIMEIGNTLRYQNMREISDAAAMARSFVHKRAQQLRAATTQPHQTAKVGKSQHVLASKREQSTIDSKHPVTTSSSAIKAIKQSPTVGKLELPEVGDLVHVSSLGKKGTILRVEPSKEEIVVQVGSMKLKVKLMDIQI